MTAKTLQEYAKLSAQIKELEGKRDGMKIDIISDLNGMATKKQVTDFGTFSMGERIVYAFTRATEKLMFEAKNAQEREINLGKAKVKSKTEYLRFQGKGK